MAYYFVYERSAYSSHCKRKFYTEAEAIEYCERNDWHIRRRGIEYRLEIEVG